MKTESWIAIVDVWRVHENDWRAKEKEVDWEKFRDCWVAKERRWSFVKAIRSKNWEACVGYCWKVENVGWAA